MHGNCNCDRSDFKVEGGWTLHASTGVTITIKPCDLPAQIRNLHRSSPEFSFARHQTRIVTSIGTRSKCDLYRIPPRQSTFCSCAGAESRLTSPKRVFTSTASEGVWINAFNAAANHAIRQTRSPILRAVVTAFAWLQKCTARQCCVMSFAKGGTKTKLMKKQRKR